MAPKHMPMTMGALKRVGTAKPKMNESEMMEGRMDMDTLKRAGEIMSDPKRMARCKKVAKGEMEQMGQMMNMMKETKE